MWVFLKQKIEVPFEEFSTNSKSALFFHFVSPGSNKLQSITASRKPFIS